MNNTILRVEDAHTFIGHHHILQGLSFEARADAVTVLIGRNGAGKSTTLRSVMGLLPPSQGKILYNGKEIHNKKRSAQDRLVFAYKVRSGNRVPCVCQRILYAAFPDSIFRSTVFGI